MVVFFPPRRRRDSSDFDDDEPGSRHYYVLLDTVSSSDDNDDDDDGGQRRPTPRGRRHRRRRNRHARLILEEASDSGDDDEEESDDWDPCLHVGELPRRPMSRFHKACIDVYFVVATVAAQGVFVWTAIQDVGGAADKVIRCLIVVPLMLPVMICIVYLAARIHFLVTRDFSWRPPPAPAPADENV